MKVFDPKYIKKTRKAYRCFGCLRDFQPGGGCLFYPFKEKGEKVSAIRFCPECTYLMTEHSAMDAFHVKEGGFTDTLIPNCLRKKRDAFRKYVAEQAKHREIQEQ